MTDTISAPDAGWASRIVGEGDEDPAQLLANPRNWRIHPQQQQAALASVLDRVGWVQRIIVNRTTGHVVDGHLRAALALQRGEASVPVLYVELDADEEQLVLATIDPIGAMAATDRDKLRELLDEISLDDADLQDTLDRMTEMPVEDDGLRPGVSLADQFGVPPFSVLDARAGYWQDRKRAWLALGIKSELGRGADLAYTSNDKLQELQKKIGKQQVFRKDWSSQGPGGVLYRSHAALDPGYYRKKQIAEEQLGRTLTNQEFEASGLYEPRTTTGTEGTGTSVFDPVLCELAYRWYCPPGGTVLDPFAGGSVRGVVAGMLGRSYVGIDLSAEQLMANRDQAALILPAGQRESGASTDVRWIAGDSGDVLAQGHADLPDQVDYVWTCPPYADLEVYSDDPRDLSTMPYPDFIARLRDIIRMSCDRLREDRFAGIVIGDVRDRSGYYRSLPGDVIAAFRDAGLELYSEAVLVTPVGSLAVRAGRYFTTARKLGMAHQVVLWFVKGDVRRAVETLGPVEVQVDLPVGDDDGAF